MPQDLADGQDLDKVIESEHYRVRGPKMGSAPPGTEELARERYKRRLEREQQEEKLGTRQKGEGRQRPDVGQKEDVNLEGEDGAVLELIVTKHPSLIDYVMQELLDPLTGKRWIRRHRQMEGWSRWARIDRDEEKQTSVQPDGPPKKVEPPSRVTSPAQPTAPPPQPKSKEEQQKAAAASHTLASDPSPLGARDSKDVKDRGA